MNVSGGCHTSATSPFQLVNGLTTQASRLGSFLRINGQEGVADDASEDRSSLIKPQLDGRVGGSVTERCCFGRRSEGRREGKVAQAPD
jgi:hypothetical protein